MLISFFFFCRVNLVEVHTSLILMCLLEAELPDALVEVIVSSDSFLSLQASILLGKNEGNFPYIFDFFFMLIPE